MMKHRLRTAILVAALGTAHAGHAEEGAALGDVTAQDLLKLLVDEGVIDKNKLKALAEKIKERKKADAGAAVESVAAEQRDVKPASEAQVVRVPYVPKYIRDEIRDQVRIGLKEDVSRDVLAQAKQEQWGLPGALPEWVNRIKISGDVRVRAESIAYAKGNDEFSYYNVARVNANRSLYTDYADPNMFLNTTDDYSRLRERFRLGIKAKVNDRFEAGARLVTGNMSDPVSTNQSLGNYGQKWQSTFDQGYLRYTSLDRSIIISGGRFDNPFFSTDLVYDNDLSFEGVAASWWFLRSDSMDNEFRTIDPFITIGAFPLSDAGGPENKWLYGAQTGIQYLQSDQSKLTAAIAYYAYDNIVGKKEDPDDRTYDYTAPAFWQKGNTLFNIASTFSTDPTKEPTLYAHAVDYKLLDAFVEYDIANFAPVHVILTGDYVKNLGYSKSDVLSRTGIAVDPRTKGYQFRAAIGWPYVNKARDWQLSFIYRYLERDAVLAEFTDSDFHQGGTDAKGYILKFDYGIADNTWLSLRWLSSNEIDGDTTPDYSTIGTGKLGIDTLQLDVNAKF